MTTATMIATDLMTSIAVALVNKAQAEFDRDDEAIIEQAVDHNGGLLLRFEIPEPKLADAVFDQLDEALAEELVQHDSWGYGLTPRCGGFENGHFEILFDVDEEF